MKSDGVAVGDGLKLPLIRQKSKIFATFPRGEGFTGERRVKVSPKATFFKLFPKEIPQLSIIHYQLSITKGEGVTGE